MIPPIDEWTAERIAELQRIMPAHESTVPVETALRMLAEISLRGEEIARLRAREDAWMRSMPCCQELDCRRPATRGTTSHEPERCDEHAPGWMLRECDWADLLRGGGGE